MALTYSSFESFDEVVAHYENTKPMGGSTNKGKDIRPIGDRKRKYERIVKISDNCYALSDGFHFGDPVFSWSLLYTKNTNFTPSLNDMEKYAPIVWRKSRDGTEQVKIRNGYGNGAHTGRYAFIYRHTPKGLRFIIDNGKQYVAKTMGTYSPSADGKYIGRDQLKGQYSDERYYLAKTRTAPRAIYDYIKNQQNNNWWVGQQNKWVMLHDDNSTLVFHKAESESQFAGPNWVHVEGTGCTLPKGPRVNKEAKAKLKDSIKKYFEWGMTMSPLLLLEDGEYLAEQNRTLNAAYGSNHWRQVTPKIGREIVRDEQHPARVAFWVDFAKGCYSPSEMSWAIMSAPLLTKIETKEDVAYVRSRFNAFINKELGFITK